MSDTPVVSFVIPNWNGAQFISRCLSSVAHAIREAGAPAEVVVVDDASTDDSAAVIRARFPNVRLVVSETNGGFIASANRGAEEARGRLLLLLNNDIVLQSGFLPNLLRHFPADWATGANADSNDDDDLFGVTALTTEWDTGEPNHAWMAAEIEPNGRFHLRWDAPREARETLFLQGGAALVRRDRFLELGGFDPIFAPGYWEDYDLSLRARTRGWRNLYEPAARATHVGKASFTARYGHDGVRQLERRNRLLFCWMHFDPRTLRALPRQIAGETLRGDGSRFKALLKAFRARKSGAEGRARRLAERSIDPESILREFATMGNRES